MAKPNLVLDSKTKNYASFDVNALSAGDVYTLLIGIDKEHVRMFYAALKDLNRSLEASLKRTFNVGDKVYFQSRKRGERVDGVITDLGRGRMIRMRTSSGATWRVSPSLLNPSD